MRLLSLALAAALPALPAFASATEDIVFTEADAVVRYQSPRPVLAATFAGQLPEAPGSLDHPLQSSCPAAANLAEILVQWVEPSTGVDASTGLLINLAGINSMLDCDPGFPVPDDAWPEAKNVVLATVYYRNASYLRPYDFGKYQISDVLRGLGALLEAYPQIDRSRLYLYGGSGGGQVGLQTYLLTSGLWAEVHIHCPITRLTTEEDVSSNEYEEDPASGWNINTGWPVGQGGLTDFQWNRYQAERALRSPQENARSAEAPDAGNPPAAPIYVMHGTADDIVDVQHTFDLRAAVEENTGVPATQTASNVWQLEQWTLVSIMGGDHYYAGAAASENTRAAATNSYVPDAFTRSRTEAPALAFSAATPTLLGYRYVLDVPSLAEASIGTEQVLETAVPQEHWTIYP